MIDNRQDNPGYYFTIGHRDYGLYIGNILGSVKRPDPESGVVLKGDAYNVCNGILGYFGQLFFSKLPEDVLAADKDTEKAACN